MIRCPWFDDINTYEDEKCQFSCKTMKQLYKHIVDYPHQEIALKVAELVAEKQERECFSEDDTKIILGEPSIPVSKIEEKIAELETHIPPEEADNPNPYNTAPYGIKLLKSLLPKK